MEQLTEIPADRIPRRMFVACPREKNFMQVRVADKCAGGCPSFNHFVEVAQADAFEARYRVVCIHPMARRMTEVEA